ncbi:periphilin-1 isoform X2 [Erpetoichthys calabaricus]|uniref:periphilin-1 isoform X2 n=1 Tax=Erpetoichthys calabaricus TaxID=27687 RepID=UPI002234100B|nr:periphilin-1 isoform X2 [Erpetoichthys calabaricus]
MAYRRENREMWNDPHFDYVERHPRERFPPGRGGSYQRIVNLVPRKSQFNRPSEGSYGRDYGYDDEHRNYGDNQNFGNHRRSGPGHRWDDEYRWHKEDYHGPRSEDYREDRDHFRRKGFLPPPHVRERSPGRERLSNRSVNTSRDTSPLSPTGQSTSKLSVSSDKINNPSPTSEPATEEPVVTQDTSAEIRFKDAPPEKDTRRKLEEENEKPQSSQDSIINQSEKDSLNERSKVIAAKAKDIEKVYRQDCETFGMVVKMLIDKDPSLEKQIQVPLRENLRDIGERCIEELKQFIVDYDSSVAGAAVQQE